MGYVIKDLDEEEKKSNGTSSPDAPSISGPSKAQGVASVTAPQQTAQQQRGTGFTNLSEWLNAGQGRDKAISSTGNTLLGNEKTKLGDASTKAEASLAGNNVLAVGDVAGSLDRESGVASTPPPVNRPAVASTPQPAPIQQPAVRGLSPGGISSVTGPRQGSGLIVPTRPPQKTQPEALPINLVDSGPANTGAGTGSSTPLTPTINSTGPSLEDVLGQHYTGQSGIDYKAGDDFQGAKMLGNTGTVADVLAKDAIGQGQYTQGMRALDNVLYGADAASQNAIKANATNTDAFQKDATGKAADFEVRAQDRADRMSDQAGKTRTALEKIGDSAKTTLEKRAKDANDAANTAYATPGAAGWNDSTWQGSAAGSATAGNVMNDSESKRFSALNKLLGYESPTKSGEYKQGSWVDPNPKQSKEIDAAVKGMEVKMSSGGSNADSLHTLMAIFKNTPPDQREALAAKFAAKYPDAENTQAWINKFLNNPGMVDGADSNGKAAVSPESQKAFDDYWNSEEGKAAFARLSPQQQQALVAGRRKGGR